MRVEAGLSYAIRALRNLCDLRIATVPDRQEFDRLTGRPPMIHEIADEALFGRSAKVVKKKANVNTYKASMSVEYFASVMCVRRAYRSCVDFLFNEIERVFFMRIACCPQLVVVLFILSAGREL